jgi:hypothetical protein
MKIYSNDKLINRNKKIGNITSIGSLLILGVGMFFSFKDKDGSYLVYTFSALIVGFLLFQIGNFYMSKWGKSPRPDEKITAALKGLDDRYSLYHYTTPISHLLVGPAGILCLIPYQQAGTITYNKTKGKWKQTGGNTFLKIFGGEGLGHPEREVKFTIEDANKFFAKNELVPSEFSPEPVMIFTNERVTLEAEESEIPAVTGAKLKEFIRKKAKTTALPDQIARDLEKTLSI